MLCFFEAMFLKWSGVIGGQESGRGGGEIHSTGHPSIYTLHSASTRAPAHLKSLRT
jgi:hypothetical protein